jgi:hypothetical protein
VSGEKVNNTQSYIVRLLSKLGLSLLRNMAENGG